ncbi:hypothetical protein Bbelb_402800 [Branchiostoma belcheri]|nr:hypothetical protein Bbelb_402800 [Branchiostoma belcheri]
MAQAVNPAGEATTAAVLRVEVNPAGEATTAAVLRVEGEARPPTFIKKLDKQLKVKEGRVVMLEVMVDGCPKPKVKWFMDEEPVMSQDYDIIVDGGRHALTIKEVFDEDAGVFKCRAKNSQGEVTCTCQLSVVPPSSDEERERAEAPVVQQPVVQPTVQPAVQPVLVEEPPMEVITNAFGAPLSKSIGKTGQAEKMQAAEVDSDTPVFVDALGDQGRGSG